MGTLYVVATPIGNLGDMTTRSIETLREVDLILVEDTRQTIKLLSVFDIKTKMLSYHKFNEKSRCQEIIDKLLSGQNIALVSDAGTPCISDPGFIIVKEARENKIPVMGIPGSSAVVNALAISGLETNSFTFYGFLPIDNSKQKKEIQLIKELPINTIVFYESPKRIVKFIEKLKTYFPDSLVFIASDMTKKFERSFYGKIEEVYEIIANDSKIEKGEYVVILQKESFKKEEKSLCLEAVIIDEMIKSKCSSKEAIKNLSEKNYKKNDLYEASLNLKNIV